MAEVKKEPKKEVKKEPKKKPKKAVKPPPPPPPTPEEIRAHAQLEIDGADLALDFRDQAALYRKAAALLKSIPADAEPAEGVDDASLAEEYLRRADELQETGFRDAYAEATAAMEQASHADDYYHAATALRRIEEYQDAAALAEQCEHKYQRLSHRQSPKLLIGVLILVLIAAIVVGLQTPFGRYQMGRMYLSRARYANAMSLFSGLEDYRDSQELEHQSRYQLAIRHMQNKRYKKAVSHFNKLGDYQDSAYQKAAAEQELLRAASPGDSVPYGQTDWILLETDRDSALLLRERIIPRPHPFSDQPDHSDWSGSNARAWLNETYLTKSFSPVEQKLLLPQSDAGDDSPVFLLSQAEAEQYGTLLVPPAKETSKKKEVPALKNWWLRSPGTAPGAVAFVSPDGKVMPFGYPPDSTEIFLRPAIRVSLAHF